MKWEKTDNVKIPVKSWCQDIEDEALKQAVNLANHPVLYRHVALMPDCHVGYGMPIGGVIACDNAVIPNAVGVDIGCGMGAIETDLDISDVGDKKRIRTLMEYVKARIPVGEGHSHRDEQKWREFERFLDTVKGKIPSWLIGNGRIKDAKNLGTLGGGNHFIELQVSETGRVWGMLHSGSRNMGYRVAGHYQKYALDLNRKWKVNLPDRDLAYLPADDEEGSDYIRDMNFALDYAAENRRRMMEVFKEGVVEVYGPVNFKDGINIHHNYASLETHFGKKVWIHRKGATSAMEGQKGIIPGSMGTSSYIVEGLGNEESFKSCSHGAGRIMGRKEACRRLTVDECDRAMEGIVHDRWHKYKGYGKRKSAGEFDLSEAPLAYKNIDEVMDAQKDLVKVLVKLRPLGVVKG